MSTPEATDPPTVESEPVSEQATSSPTSLVVAIIWAVAAVIFGIILLFGAKDQSYGGDAYTGLQNAVVLAVRGIAFLVFGSAALGIVIALRRDRP